MQVEAIRNVTPGEIISEKGFKDYGIHGDKAVIAGTLCRIEDLYFIKSKTMIYLPRKYDIVIGKVFFSCADYYKIDLCGCTGILPTLSFWNATKKNRPELERDQFVVCQVVRVEGNEPLLCCKKEGLGKVDEAFAVESWKIRMFYFNDFIKNIARNRTFKIIMAMNGFVWLDGEAETKKDVLNLIRSYQGEASSHSQSKMNVKDK